MDHSLSLVRTKVPVRANFSLDDRETTEVIGRTSYHNSHLDALMPSCPKKEEVEFQFLLHPPFTLTTTGNLGILELLLYILEDFLDLHSLIKFRQVSKSIRDVFYFIPKYGRAVSYSPTPLWALLRTGLAANITLNDFDREFCRKTCRICGKYGSFISLLFGLRCCYKCILQSAETQLRSLDKLEKHYKIGEYELSQLTTFVPLPGKDPGAQGNRPHAGKRLFSPLQAWKILSKKEPSRQGFPLDMERARKCKINLEGCCAFPWYNKETGDAENGVSCRACRCALADEMGATRSYEEIQVFSHEEYVEHYRWCQGAQAEWGESDLRLD